MLDIERSIMQCMQSIMWYYALYQKEHYAVYAEHYVILLRYYARYQKEHYAVYAEHYGG
jgi:hypothetical protein